MKASPLRAPKTARRSLPRRPFTSIDRLWKDFFVGATELINPVLASFPRESRERVEFVKALAYAEQGRSERLKQLLKSKTASHSSEGARYLSSWPANIFRYNRLTGGRTEEPGFKTTGQIDLNKVKVPKDIALLYQFESVPVGYALRYQVCEFLRSERIVKLETIETNGEKKTRLNMGIGGHIRAVFVDPSSQSQTVEFTCQPQVTNVRDYATLVVEFNEQKKYYIALTPSRQVYRIPMEKGENHRNTVLIRVHPLSTVPVNLFELKVRIIPAR